MKWSKHKFEISEVPKFHAQYLAVARKGEANLDNCKCIFQLKDDAKIYYFTLLDFLDAFPKLPPLEKFYFYQPLNKT
jgi:hypothetical protein